MKIECTVKMNTPAFLGNAEQRGQWRVPPFRHQLRYWWRIASGYAQKSTNEMLEAEQKLFGGVGKNQGRKSAITVALGEWRMGEMQQALKLNKLDDPPVPADLYAGYGPVASGRKAPPSGLKAAPAIKAEEENQLSLILDPFRLPATELDSAHKQLQQTLELANAFGTIGGRSRNAWGSFQLDGSENPVAWLLDKAHAPYSRAWQECIQRTHASAIGADERGPLVWISRPLKDMRSLLFQGALLRRSLNTASKSVHRSLGRATQNLPVAKNAVRGGRVPSQFRFKALVDPDGQHRLLCTHVPHSMPEGGLRPGEAQKINEVARSVWPRLHKAIDASQSLERI